jgi:D-3-phosphoglycerate dehydrogenase
MIGESALHKIKEGARLLNFARGELVDDTAVISALDTGRLGSYVTDFPTEEMLGRDEVIPIPHLGASTPEAEENCAVMAAAQLIDFLENGNIRNSVNFPECIMPRSGSRRLAVANRNIPNMVGQITTILARHGMNITDMLNRHRGDFAYNIIDVDGAVSEQALSDLSDVEGVVSVRHIR